MKMSKKKSAKKGNLSVKFADNSVLSLQVLKEFKVATKRYIDSVKRRTIFKNSALYGTPWFMIIGPEKSGKSTLLSAANLHFPLKYPQEKDGQVVSNNNWSYGNKAIWLDTPGRLVNPEGKDLLQAVYYSLSEVRPKRPIDGIICVISAEDMLNSNPESVRSLANSLRAKIDELIATWGVELPVFCIISKTDTIPGFYEFFNDSSVQWSEQLLGTTLSTEQQAEPPRRVFQQEHELLCQSLKSLRLKRLSKEKDNSIRRLICRFVIQFEGMQGKIGDFFAELFKDSSYEGKPVFKGFYFVSCKTFETSALSQNVQKESPVVISKTIADHPLNPHRNVSSDPLTKHIAAKKIKSFFTNKLFDELIPNGTQVLLRTHRSSRKEMIRYWSLTAIFTLSLVALSYYFVSSYDNVSSMYKKTHQEIANASKRPNSIMDAYVQFGNMAELIEQYREFEKKGVPLSYGIGFMKKKNTYEKLKTIYFSQARNLLVIPSMAHLEYGIKNFTSDGRELTGDQYTALYRLLKAYLSMSEAVAQSRDKIDTLMIRESIEQGLYQAILHKEKNNRLPVNFESILKKNIGLYCYYLKKGEMPLMQQNQVLVQQTRARLSRIPDSRMVYESMRDRLQIANTPVPMEEILGGNTDGFMTCNRPINVIYTQVGWERFVEDEISKSIKDPFKVDWVIGNASKAGTPVFDKDQVESDLKSFYIEDLCQQWLSVLASITIKSSGDMAGAAIFTKKLSAEKSEMSLIFENVLKLSQVDLKPKESAALDAIKKAGGKKVAAMEKKAAPLKGLFKAKDPIDQINEYFEPLKNFMDSKGNGGITAYREQLAILSEAVSRCAKQGDVTGVFNGKTNDPLLSAWTFSENTLSAMPDYMQKVITPVLKKPLEITAASIVSSITRELNEKWQVDVTTPFASKFIGKYPFNRTNNESSFDEVMEFYRPVTGSFYGYVARNLTPYLYKENTTWKSRPVGCITLNFKKEFFESLQKADKISQVFYNTDGTPKVHEISMYSLPQNKVPGSVFVKGQEYKLVADDKKRIRFSWPDLKQPVDVMLKLYVNQSYTDEQTFPGNWGLMRLFESSRVSVLNSSSFSTNWERNIQNMVMVRYGAQVQVSGSTAPFTEKLFVGFTFPKEIVEPGK